MKIMLVLQENFHSSKGEKMFTEEITWWSFPSEMPVNMVCRKGKIVLIKRKGLSDVEYARIWKDRSNSLGVYIQLNSGGVNSGTDVTNQVILIALNPKGKKLKQKVETTQMKDAQPVK